MMTLAQRQAIYLQEYEMFGWSLQDTFKFINLVGVLYTKAVEKDSELTVYQLLNKIHPHADQYQKIYERTQFHVMSHNYQKHNFSPLGLKNAKEIADEIRRMLDIWLPF